MSKQFEDFVRKNREAFDDKEPSERVWKKIDTAMFPSDRKSLWSSVAIWRAAAMLFMAISVYLFVVQTKNSGGIAGLSDNHNSAAMSEFRDIEQFYVEQISHKRELIEEFHKTEGLNGFTQDFQQLEAMYLVLKDEMKSHPSQKVKDALVLNLLVRIDLLNQQLHKLEQGDYKDQDEMEKEDRSV